MTMTGARHQTAMGAGGRRADLPWTAMVVAAAAAGGLLGTMTGGAWIETGGRGTMTGAWIETGATGTAAETGTAGTSARGMGRRAAGEPRVG